MSVQLDRKFRKREKSRKRQGFRIMSVQLDRKLRKWESSRKRQGFRKPRAEASVNWGLRDPMMRAGFGCGS